MTVTALFALNSCRCQKLSNGPAICSSSNDRGASYCVIFDINLIRAPKCIASQVITAPGPSRSDAMLVTTRSCVVRIDATWADTLRARSKHRSAGARIVVASRMVPIASSCSRLRRPDGPGRPDRYGDERHKNCADEDKLKRND